MGRKNHGKAHGRVKLPVQETNEEEGVPKISPQKRSEVKNLVGKLLKVTSTILPTPNASKEWEIHLEIEKLLEKINKLESDMKIPISDRDTRIEEFINWMKENGAEIDGIKIAQFPGYGYGIKAEKNFAQGDLLIAVPRKVMLTTENVGDSLLVLPAEYTTVLYFKTNELQELKGSPSLEPALKQCRNIARQYAYFSNLFQQSTDPGIASLREVFTYEQYCWAVSTVMTRQNFVPSSDGKSMLTALIPMWDMCNHTNGKLSTDFNAVQDRSECMACRDYQAGEQIFIFYGPRTNSELFVHNGFVYPDNEHDGLRLKLGVSREDPLQPERSKLLCRLGIPAAGDFLLRKGPDPVDGRLLAFLRVFNMGSEHLKHWLSSDRSCDLVYPDCALETEVESKMWKFLLTRINLLQRAYPTTLEEDCKKLKNPLLTPCSLLAVQLRISEKLLLDAAEEYVKQRIKT
ncbi:actin-histidine N-methyltransferase isoform X3 [Cryptotermes secundus]|uniref:actin-histidine N-methyltransferase isoform X3 n=1 Tax=Cryptotermes secundus TaxID=105785 RepID=UPI000CD7AEF1|nr:actin-histidine N-methyltransferase isoform X3 [Cryptotermes secundus]